MGEAQRIGTFAAFRYQRLVGPIRGPALVNAPDACLAISKRQLACSHGTDPHRCRPGQLWPERGAPPPPASLRLGRDIIGLFAPHHALDSAFRSVKGEGMPQPNGPPPCPSAANSAASWLVLPVFPPPIDSLHHPRRASRRHLHPSFRARPQRPRVLHSVTALAQALARPRSRYREREKRGGWKKVPVLFVSWPWWCMLNTDVISLCIYQEQKPPALQEGLSGSVELRRRG